MKPSAGEVLRNQRAVVWIRGLIPHRLLNRVYHLPRAVIANAVYRFPSKRLTVVGVTGTKGKTTTAHMMYHILREQKKNVLLISTIGAFFGPTKIDTGLHVTNPEPFALQKLLRQAADEGYEYVVLEVTSHGLAQFRNWGIRFALGVFTQVRADHITYHGGVEEYKKAKSRLVKMSSKVVLNSDDPSLKYLLSVAKQHDVPAVFYKGSEKRLKSQNEEAAIAAAVELGIRESESRKALESFPGIPGRMEVMKKRPFTLVIDFAHTPESLEASLSELRPMVKKDGKLLAVFGCAGDRDPGRRKMGAVAAKLSDMFIITAEDPRTEGVEKISDEIRRHALSAGAREIPLKKAVPSNKKNGATFTHIPDRQEAINFAIANANPGDVIGFFGKGHEKSMCFGATEYTWSEHKAVRKALSLREKGKR
ncbi:hypothetical protein IH980_01325 [Patescibacteria group bacterium]|nr:hypothetical protein [Patescibacteria group bacterium]